MISALPIYIINLDRASERWHAIRSQFFHIGLVERIERLPAEDGSAPGFSAAGYEPASWRDRWTLSPSEQAIFISHRQAWTKLIHEGCAAAVICEDDILLSRRFSEAVWASAGLLDRHGIVKLDGFNTSARYGARVDSRGFEFRAILDAVPSAACYMLNADAATVLLHESVTFCETLDDFVFRTRTGLSPLQIFPAVAVQGMCVKNEAVPPAMRSTSRKNGDGSEPADKGPIPYRLKKELARLGKRMSWKIWKNARLLSNGGVICCPPLAKDLPPYR